MPRREPIESQEERQSEGKSSLREPIELGGVKGSKSESSLIESVQEKEPKKKRLL